jgi:hypothetical protein
VSKKKTWLEDYFLRQIFHVDAACHRPGASVPFIPNLGFGALQLARGATASRDA